MGKSTYIQVGVTSLRDPKGNILPAQPIYIKVNENIKSSGLTDTEETSLDTLVDLFANKFKQYTDGCAQAGIKI